MTLAALKDSIRRLKPRQQSALLRYLHCLKATDDPSWERKVRQGMRNYAEGEYLTREEVRAQLAQRDRQKPRGSRRPAAAKAA